jgi:type II secretory pathway pseudopilin PulG
MLIVIAIIMLLVGIFIPSVASIMRSAAATKTRARMKELENGIDAYHGRIGYYPGQVGYDNSYTGSQWLARAMYTPLQAKNEGGDPLDEFPTNAFCEYVDKHLFKDGNREYTLSDLFGKPMAICYYRSNIKERHTLDQYAYDHNKDHTGGDKNKGEFEEVIRDPAEPAGTLPHNDGQYLLIAPGADREYFTSDDVNNIRK